MSNINKTSKVDCAVHPKELQPNQDITGIGISLSWTVTAGLALLLVIANYFVAYRPDIDPFDSRAPSSGPCGQSSFRSNPIDKQLLGWRIKKVRQVDQASTNEAEQPRRDRVRAAFIQCMLTMSDYQLITGLSVLISGYSQLPSGISMLHWERIIDLAWFSSITHLCCLTFLRDYLYRNRHAQIWRLCGMVVLIVMLSVALIPSSGYVETDSAYGPYWDGYDSTIDYAICYFKHSEEGKRAEYYKHHWQAIALKKQNTIISAAILILGMINRIWRLFENSTNFFFSARRWFSHRFKATLRWILKTKLAQSRIFVDLIYRPLLASYLVFHVLLDMLLSKAFEVWWLAIGLSWGLGNLLPIDDTADQEWTFGQVIASLMLVAPVIALAETLTQIMRQRQPNSGHLSQSSTSTHSLIQESSLLSNEQPLTVRLSRDDPDYDRYDLSLTFNVAVHTIMAFLAALSLVVVVQKAMFRGEIDPLQRSWALRLLPVHFMACFLCSLSIDSNRPETRAGRVAVGTSSFILYGSSIVGGFVLAVFDEISGYPYVAYPFVVYVVLLVVERLLKKRRASKVAPLLLNQNNGSSVSSESIPATLLLTPQAVPSGRNSTQLPLIDTSSAFGPPRRQDTEASIGLASPRRAWTNSA